MPSTLGTARYSAECNELTYESKDYLMSTITVPRSGVTAEEVTAVLRRELGSRYTVTPSMMATGFGKEVQGSPNTVLVAAN